MELKSFDIVYNKNLIKLTPISGGLFQDKNGRVFKKHYSGKYQLVKNKKP